jgi:hypothetical protein
MHNELVTPFWRKAYDSLPAHVRGRYHGQIVAAERWELAIGSVIKGYSRLKHAVQGLFHTPRARHGH